MYTSFCPEKPEADVNFISGDYLPANSVASARVEARLIANQGMHWDLMAWGFNIQHNFFVEKTPVQLMQEAAATLMFGGAFQVYNVQNVGKISERAADGWKEIADFVRERAELVHALPYNRTGYFYSTAGYRYQKEMIYNNPGDARAYDNSGELLAAADTLLNFDGGFTHYFAEHLDEYENLIVCNFGEIEPQMKERILAWVERGGKLLLSGTSGLAADKDAYSFGTGVEYQGVSGFNPAYLQMDKAFAPEWLTSPLVLYGAPGKLRAAAGERWLGKVLNPYFQRSYRHFSSHQHTPFSPAPTGLCGGVIRDNLAVLAFPVFSIYRERGQIALKRKKQEDALARFAAALPVERNRVMSRELREEEAANAELIFGELSAATGRRDMIEVRALLAGYRYFLRYIGGEGAESAAFFALAAEL